MAQGIRGLVALAEGPWGFTSKHPLSSKEPSVTKFQRM